MGGKNAMYIAALDKSRICEDGFIGPANSSRPLYEFAPSTENGVETPL